MSGHARERDINCAEDAVIEHEAMQGGIGTNILPDDLTFIVDVFKTGETAGARKHNRTELASLEEKSVPAVCIVIKSDDVAESTR